MHLLKAFHLTMTILGFVSSICARFLDRDVIDYQSIHKIYAPSFNNFMPKDYVFEYSVSDQKTNDHKSQWEHRKDGKVRGMYSLLEADGSTRLVQYVADKYGFRAILKRIGTNHPWSNYKENKINNPRSSTFSRYYHTGSSKLRFDEPDEIDSTVDILVPAYNFGETTEIHGFTGNSEDDSQYTNYGDNDDHGIKINSSDLDGELIRYVVIN